MIAQPLDAFAISSCAVRSSTAPDAASALDVARELLEAIGADAEAEVLRRDVLELVRLVDDRVAAGGNHLAVRVLPHRGVGAEQVMVDDDHVGLGGALAHPRDEAVVVARALGAEAGLRGRRHVVPERQVFRQVLELGAVAGLGARRPLADRSAGSTSCDARGAGAVASS